MAGDVNGDGHDDVATLVANGDPYPDGVYVVFGEPFLRAGPFASGDLGGQGLRIVSDGYGSTVDGVGDVDGDGLDDVAFSDGRRIVVVFGRRAGGTVDVTTPGDWGFVVEGGAWYVGGRDGDIAALGDQDGDGRDDFAMLAGTGGAQVVLTPEAPAGKRFTVDDPELGYRLLHPEAEDTRVFPVGDQDGDGRREVGLASFARDGGPIRVWAVTRAARGTSIAVTDAVDAGKAFELVADDPVPDPNPDWEMQLEHVTGLGDQNADGRDEIALVVYNDNRWLLVPFSPRLGTRRDISGLVSDGGYRLHVYNGSVRDVGDQDGDGRSDFADGNYVRLTDAAVFRGDQETAGSPATWWFDSGEVSGRMRDVNGDSVPEIVTTPYGHFSDAAGNHGRYGYDAWYSTPLPRFLQASVAESEPGQVHALARVRATARGPMEPQAWVDVDGMGYWAQIIPAGNGEYGVHATFWMPAGTYAVAIRVVDARGRSSAWRGTVGVSSSPGPHGWSPTGPIFPGHVHGPRIGTAKDDRLKGTEFNDLMRGRRGDDWLWGLGSKDVLYGESGHDRLWGGKGDDTLMGDEGRDRVEGGPGADHLYGDLGRDVLLARDGRRDIVRCGGGSDRAVVDRADVVSRCERVRVARPLRP